MLAGVAWCLSLVPVATSLADPPSMPAAAVTAEFARRVQPLLINSCGAGACHGAPDSPEPRLARFAGGMPADARMTRANLQSFLGVLGPQVDLQPLLVRLANRHPASAPQRGFVARPFSPAQRITIENWLAKVRADQRRPASPSPPSLGERPASAPASPNRFQALLDAAAHPQELPPPERIRGIIFGPVEPPSED